MESWGNGSFYRSLLARVPSYLDGQAVSDVVGSHVEFNDCCSATTYGPGPVHSHLQLSTRLLINKHKQADPSLRCPR